MKNLLKFLAIIVLVAVIGFGFIACGGGDNNNNNNENENENNANSNLSESKFQVSGKFTKSGEAGSGEVKFKIADAANYSRSARAVGSESFAVKGELEDGDLTVKLSGTYDPRALSYSVSASASIMRYTINGGFDEKGASTGSTATLLVKNGDDWKPFTFVIEEGVAVAITGNAVESRDAGGVPEFARGYWYASSSHPKGGTWEQTLLASQWSVSYYDVVNYTTGGGSYYSRKYSIISVTSAGANKYVALYGYSDYEQGATMEQKKAAVVEYLESKGINGANTYGPLSYEETLTFFSNPPTDTSVLFNNDGSLGSWFNIPDATFNDYYSTDYLEQYFMKADVTPAPLYSKYQFEFKDNNTVMEICGYGNAMTGMDWATSLAALEGYSLQEGKTTLSRK